ncbi:hypothetical protein HDG40_001264 [Paraburkholderia sp. JPY158]|uniref:Uncharacterized protein n=1 Tax=Paraburkholderia atlantica TaxID=2654982 RepID=A0A7W8Q3I4_PARAM|nr:hypothetical protein [Paraburkholderia atlantica]
MSSAFACRCRCRCRCRRRRHLRGDASTECCIAKPRHRQPQIAGSMYPPGAGREVEHPTASNRPVVSSEPPFWGKNSAKAVISPPSVSGRCRVRHRTEHSSAVMHVEYWRTRIRTVLVLPHVPRRPAGLVCPSLHERPRKTNRSLCRVGSHDADASAFERSCVCAGQQAGPNRVGDCCAPHHVQSRARRPSGLSEHSISYLRNTSLVLRRLRMDDVNGTPACGTPWQAKRLSEAARLCRSHRRELHRGAGSSSHNDAG